MAQASKKWTTIRLESLMNNYKLTGVIPDDHPFFNRKIGKRKAGISWGYTQEELLELVKCEEDIVYFANNYAKILTSKGRCVLKEVGGLRDYQEDLLRSFQHERYNIVLASRQIGKSITVAIYVAWYILFNKDANILLLSSTGDKAKDLLKKIKEIQDFLPFFMQVGLSYDATQRRIYGNGCSLLSETTTEDAGVSGTYKFVYWDEMALLDREMQDKIFTGVFPTMSSYGEEAKFIITSTPRDRRSKFASIWEGAKWGEGHPKWNGFKATKVYWWQVKGRGEEWKEKEILVMGKKGFSREYDLSFDSEDNLLLEDDIKNKVLKGLKEYVKVDSLCEGMFYMDKDYDVSYFSDGEKRFHISIDLAGGRKGDYTVFNIFEIVLKSREELDNMSSYEDEKDFFKQRQVAVVRTNEVKPRNMGEKLHDLLIEIFNVDEDNVKISVEMNHKGEIFVDKIFTYKGNNNKLRDIRDQLIVQYPQHCDFDKKESYYEEGFMQTKISKKTATDNINSILEKDSIQVSEPITIEEGESFGEDKKGNMKGLGEHDDHWMTVLNSIHYFSTEEFEEQISFLLGNIYPEEMESIEERLEGTEGDVDDIY